MSQTLRQRSEVPVEHTWDLESIFRDVPAWEAALHEVEALLPEVEPYRGCLQQSADILLAWLRLRDQMFQQAGRVLTYANLAYAGDTTDTAAAARNDQARSLLARVLAAAAFDRPEILALGEETLAAWMAERPDLAVYAHEFDQLERRREHVRSAPVEALLAAAQDPFRTASATHGILTNSDLIFAPARGRDPDQPALPVAQGTIGSLITDADREIRRTAWESYSDGYLAFKNTLANCLTAEVKQNVFRARAQHYASALEAALAGSFLPTDVFHQTVETFQAHLPVWHRYWRLRRQALGYERLFPYDVKAPLTEEQPVLPFEQAMEWIAAGMQPLGDEYVAIMSEGVLTQRWVDIYPNAGKRQGAFSSGIKGTHPFIMMSYTDDLFSLSTLAHELGHSMHSYFSREHQPFIYSRYSLFEAEVASNFNQALVRAYLLENNPEPAFQIAVLEEAMSNFHRYFFIMPTLARLELAIHERVERGEPLGGDILNGLMADLFAEGFGDEVEMDRDRVGITWAQFGHLYANFYVYQYTTGISGAHALAADILSGDSAAVGRYLDFLRAGGSRYPLDNLRQAGVDLASPEPVSRTFAVLSDYLDRLERLVAANPRTG